jgi:hypothetical protein
MFLCVQARPRFDYTKNTMWDGKIWIWSIGHWEVAVRSSVNRPAGAPVWKNDSMDKKRYSEMMVDLVFPAILENWPVGELIIPHFKIRIQQDNAPAHPKVNDASTSMVNLPSCGTLMKLVSSLLERLNCMPSHQTPLTPTSLTWGSSMLFSQPSSILVRVWWLLHPGTEPTCGTYLTYETPLTQDAHVLRSSFAPKNRSEWMLAEKWIALLLIVSEGTYTQFP